MLVAIIKILMQYLLSPIAFLLTFILPVAIYFINRKYVWFSILLTVIIEVIVNWANFIYYESQGLMILFTAAQVAVMVIVILTLKLIDAKLKNK